jgi:hypothetical protein
VTRYLVDTNVMSATAPTSPVRRRDLVEVAAIDPIHELPPEQ